MKRVSRKRKPKDLEKAKIVSEIKTHHTELEAQNEEIRTSREAIQESLDKYLELYDFSPVGIVSLSETGLILECNLAAAELLGYSRALLIGKNLILFVRSKSHEIYSEFMARALKSNTKQETEVDLLGKGGRLIYADLIGLSMTDARTHKRQLRVALTDISRQRQVIDERSAQLNGVRKELEQAQRLVDIGTLAATVAHELRNPLAAIKLAAYNVRRKAQDARLESHIKNIDNKVMESEQIINNLVFYARIRTPQLKPVNIYSIIKDAIAEAGKRHPKRAWTLTKDSHAIKNVMVDADAFQIKEALINILNNAYEATNENTGKIAVGAEVGDGAVKVSVVDNGQGIDERDLPRIFDPFFTTKTKGTGLGLSVARQIVTQHGGFVDLASRKGEGTTVTVTLPIKTKGRPTSD